jgi:superfamily II DNA or RNA helicase
VAKISLCLFGLSISASRFTELTRALGYGHAPPTWARLLKDWEPRVNTNSSTWTWPDPQTLHQATLELASSESLAFEDICVNYSGLAWMLTKSQAMRIECYLGSAVACYGYLDDPNRAEWASTYFLGVDPAFVVNLPRDIRKKALLSLQYRLWTDGLWNPRFQELIPTEPDPDFEYLSLDLALMRGDDHLDERLKTAQAKRKGYAAVQRFLNGDRAQAAEEFVKLVSKRKAGYAVFEPVVGLFAKLALLSQGDYANALDPKFGCPDFPAIHNLLRDLASYQIRQVPRLDQIRDSKIVQQPAPGLEALIVWLFRDALGISMEQPKEAAKRFSEQGFTRLYEQLSSEPSHPWIGQMIEVKPWEAWLKQLESNVEFSTPKKPVPKRAVTSQSHTAWNLSSSSIEAYEQGGPERLSILKLEQLSPVELKRAHIRPPDYFSAEDCQILQAVQADAWSSPVISQRALRLLSSHPRLYFQGRPCRLVERVQRLLLNQVSGDLVLKLTPTISTGREVLLEKGKMDQNGLLEVTVWQRSRHEKSLVSLLGQQVPIPQAAAPKLYEILRTWQRRVDIECGPGVKPLQAASLLADQAVLRLTPLKSGGLKAIWGVRPTGLPELTRVLLLNFQDQEYVGDTMLKRDADLELKLFQQARSRCPLIPDTLDFVLSEPADALELVQACLEQSIELEWPEGQAWRIRRPLQQKALKVSASASKLAQNWFELEGQLSLSEGSVIQLHQLLQCLHLGGGRYLKIGESDFVLIEENTRRQLERLEELSQSSGKSVQLAQAMIPTLAELELEGFSSDEAFQQRLASFQEMGNYRASVSKRLEAELRDYQVEGFRWLARHARMGTGACLADDMGLGKTLQAIALLLHHQKDGAHLVVCPVSVMGQWAEQLNRFAPTLQAVLFGGKDRESPKPKAGQVWICSYRVLLMDAERLKKINWAVAVLDEAQFIKNPESKTARAAFGLKSNIRVATTGTPIENRLTELWSIFAFLNPGLLGTLPQFKRRYETVLEKGQTRSRLRALISPFVLRRLKSQVLQELPARTEMSLAIELSAEERALYTSIVLEAQKDIASKEILRLLGHLTRLRQACCHPSLVLKGGSGQPSSKLSALLELINSLRDGHHRALVFSQFTSFLDIVEQELVQQDISYLRLDGSTPSAERQKRVAAFQSGEGDVFLISLKAGGSGLNLTGADYVIHLDPWWNPAAEDQASDRAHRIGQTRPVTIYRLIASNTIEEKVVQLHREKRDLAESVLEGRDAPTTLDVELLKSLLAMA